MNMPAIRLCLTVGLASPIMLTNLALQVTDPSGLPLTATLVASDFNGEGYNFVWQFTAEASGLHTVTLNADDFITPFVRRVLVAVLRSYLPIVLR